MLLGVREIRKLREALADISQRSIQALHQLQISSPKSIVFRFNSHSDSSSIQASSLSDITSSSCICGRWKNGGKPRINRAQLVCRLLYFSHNTGVFNKMEEIDIDEEEFGFSRNYFLAKESGKSGKKSARKLSEIDLVDEQGKLELIVVSLCVHDLRAEVSNIEPKHEEEIASLINSYKSLYNDWVFQLRYVL
ncbi:hypothetical protein L2E82_27094 [Cichorium intybus]|uniref:Uncharacterized protein n=1 Tax=Cichorium intybus TaxID=13427 RepID=A0ACB9CS06_CICIN|nr:hypothetical protein L2E82_27094 [Cichorium intybus]